MPDYLSTMSRILDELKKECHGIHSPRLVKAEDFDLKGYDKQDRDDPEVPVEYIRQFSGPCEDDYYGTMAYPLGTWMLVIEYAS